MATNALILAAGRGSRLKSFTEKKPKCLVELNDKPMLQWQLDAIKKAGIKDILVVTGYLEEQIKGEFHKKVNRRWRHTNMVGSLMTAYQWLEKAPCIVSYSDIIYSSDAISKLIVNTNAELSVLYDVRWKELWSKRFNDPLSDAESFMLDKYGFVIDIGRQNVTFEEIQGQYMGLLKFTPESAKWMAGILSKQPGLTDKMDMTALLRLLINNGKPVKGIPWDGLWCEVDSPDDLQIAKELFN